MIDKTDPTFGRLPEPEELNDSMSLGMLYTLEAMAKQSISAIEHDRATSWRKADPEWLKKSQSALNFYRYYLVKLYGFIDARNDDAKIVAAAMRLLEASESVTDMDGDFDAEDVAFDALMSLCASRREELLAVAG